jgi:hypothetical protein
MARVAFLANFAKQNNLAGVQRILHRVVPARTVAADIRRADE